MKISACWIVKNEAAELAASIMSVRDCAEELIVVDTGSADDTVRIAKEHGARVEHFKWTDDFSAARNFCLSFASGEYVIFLDADEYFSPALNKADRNIISDGFKKSGVDTLQVNRIELDSITGKIIGTEPHARIMRRTAVHYINRIHELAVTKDGTPPSAMLLSAYRLMHTGYSADRVTEKYIRNIAYLETQQTELSDEFELFHNHAYLMREYMALNDYEKACIHCRYLLDHYEQWNSICRTFCSNYIQRFYTVLNLMVVKRFCFSRKEIFQKLILVAKEIYNRFREVPVLELYYQMIADYRGDRFLRKLEHMDMFTGKPKALDATESRNAEAAVYGRGALEAYYRRDYDKASRFAETALQIVPECNPTVMAAILDKSFSGTNDPVSKSILEGDYQKAYDRIQQGLETQPLEYTLLEFLQIIADKASGDLALTARGQYDIWRALLDEAIDLSDVVNTGYVDCEEIKRQANGLVNISFEQFEKILKEDTVRPVTADILALHELAAPIYERKGLLVTAMRSHLLLFVKNRESDKHRLELWRLFHESENDLLATQIETLCIPTYLIQEDNL